ncbi:S locus-related glycoprotein 1 binding pollen coat protein [Arabidopsis thaliana x Arabidopsis arenosa]|uniref:S locus-related glycoprotein 1 binding pollen coat protein n=2 Tax=Arabidopsis TaxID=3701 RepID=A0A8T2AGN5_ARASU|nr:S locus-related glycoprotein 1 binding pollen coat protein [Arabidopsis thaliana x Arabidopsis arenosa]KAG7572655.1 S locus-related glycoprotein 1 binding pollen coat protein [Arabidopsis suecica]
MGNVQQGKREQCHTNIPNKSGKCIHTECKSACGKLKKGPVASICLPPKTCRCYYFCS